MFKKILAAVDGSEPSIYALHVAAQLAKEQGAELDIITSVPPLPTMPTESYGADYFPRYEKDLREAMQKKVKVVTQTLGQVEEPHLDRRLAAVQVTVVTVAWLALIAYIAAVYPGLPEVIPVHFGLDGVPNRYGSKVEMLYIAVIATIFPVMNAVFALKFGKYNRRLTVFLSMPSYWRLASSA